MPTKTTNININDNVAIISKNLTNNNQNLKKLIFVQNKDSINLSPIKKNDYLATFEIFYNINSLLLESFGGGSVIDRKFKEVPLNALTLDMYTGFLERIWMQIIKKCPNFDSVLDGKFPFGILQIKTNSKGQPVLDDIGNTIPGGNVFAYPIGFFILAEFLKVAVTKGKSVEDTIDVIMNNIPTNIDEKPWVNIIWNPVDHQIIEGGKEKEFLVSLLSISLNLDNMSKVPELTRLYQDITGNQVSPLPLIKWSGNIQEEIDDSGFLCL